MLKEWQGLTVINEVAVSCFVPFVFVLIESEDEELLVLGRAVTGPA
jgi:hypothetical protein